MIVTWINCFCSGCGRGIWSFYSATNHTGNYFANLVFANLTIKHILTCHFPFYYLISHVSFVFKIYKNDEVNQDSDEVNWNFYTFLLVYFLICIRFNLFLQLFLGFFYSAPGSGGKLTAGKDVAVFDVDVNQGRRSRRPRTLSSKLDGRFHFDKKTKLLVGHPSPLISAGEVVADPEERYQRSLLKLKRKR